MTNINQVLKLSLNDREKEFLDQLKMEIVLIQKFANGCSIDKLALLLKDKINVFAKNFSTGIQKIRTDNVDVMLINDLPEFEYNDGGLKSAKTFAIALSLLVGEPFQYLQQNNAEIAAEIRPTEGLKNTNSSGGKIELGWHTDDCFLNSKHRTKWIQLMGYHNPDKIRTNIALLDEIVNELSENTLGLLMQKRFQVKVPVSFGLNELWSDPIPIIRINTDNIYEIGVPTYNVRPMNPNDFIAQRALRELVEAADRLKKSFCIENGSALIFNNDRVLHSREPIKSDRLVLRTYIRENLSDLMKTVRENGRIFDLTKLIGKAA